MPSKRNPQMVGSHLVAYGICSPQAFSISCPSLSGQQGGIPSICTPSPNQDCWCHVCTCAEQMQVIQEHQTHMLLHAGWKRSQLVQGIKRSHSQRRQPRLWWQKNPQASGTFHPQAPTFVPPNAWNIAVPFSNTVKSYTNWNACYSWGLMWKVEDGHTSVGATNCGENPATKRISHVLMHKNTWMRGGIHAPRGCTRANYPAVDIMGGVEEYIANKCKSLFSAQPLDPTQIVNLCNNNDVTITTSNLSLTVWPQHVSLVTTAHHLFGAPTPQYFNAITIATSQAIADTGATSIFIMEGTPIKNIRPATKQLKINLPDGSQVKSTHLCNITIPGLPIVLTGHIVPRLSITSLIGIRVLCKAGCKLVFTKNFCNVIYNNKVILRGTKDPSTNLWTLPINATEDMINKYNHVGKSHLNPKQPHCCVRTFCANKSKCSKVCTPIIV